MLRMLIVMAIPRDGRSHGKTDDDVNADDGGGNEMMMVMIRM